MIVPLYSYPSSPAWTSLKAAKAANPTVPILAVVNPANGPNTAVDQNYAIGIQQLVAAGIKVIGYVHTSYGARAVASVNTDVDRWKALYPQVTGIFFDEMSNTTGKEQYYKDINAYAKTGRGYGVTIGNPGADSLPSYVGTVDIILVYESSGLPPLAMLDGWHKSYDRHNFGIIPYACPTADAAFIAAAKPKVGYIFLQNDNLPNPWDTLPSYVGTLASLLR
jgi:hypothetical protein